MVSEVRVACSILIIMHIDVMAEYPIICISLGKIAHYDMEGSVPRADLFSASCFFLLLTPPPAAFKPLWISAHSHESLSAEGTCSHPLSVN